MAEATEADAEEEDDADDEDDAEADAASATDGAAAMVGSKAPGCGIESASRNLCRTTNGRYRPYSCSKTLLGAMPDRLGEAPRGRRAAPFRPPFAPLLGCASSRSKGSMKSNALLSFLLFLLLLLSAPPLRATQPDELSASSMPGCSDSELRKHPAPIRGRRGVRRKKRG